MKLYLPFLCIMYVSCVEIVLGSSDKNGIQDIMQSIIAPAQGFQRNLDDYMNYMVAQKTVEQNDGELKERIFKRMREKMQVLIDLREAIENGGIERKSSTSYKDCGKIETQKWSPLHGKMVNANEWCLDGDVLHEDSEFDYLTEAVMTKVVEKYKEWEGIAKYIYYATEEGVLFNMPGLNFSDPYDPRLRPWYVEAATPKSKDIIIMLDLSYSMTHLVPGHTKSYLWLAKNAATTIIDILNPRDRVNIIAFNSEVIIPDAPYDSDCEGQLLNLTISNKRHLKKFVGLLHKPGSETSYIEAFKTAFDIFQRSPLQNEDRDRAILMLTDGRPDHDNITEIYDTIREGNEKMGNSVVIFTYGIGPGAADAEELLKNISRQQFSPDSNNIKAGPYRRVEDANNIRLNLTQFSDFYKAGESSTSVAFLTPYNDAFSTGMQVPMCVQVQKQHVLHGILCIDTALSDHFDTLPSYGLGSATSYAFVVDEEMKTMIHPLLPIPDEITNDLIQVPIESLEVSLTPYLERIKREDRGEINLPSLIVRSMGNVEWEGVRYGTQSATFRWFALKNEDEDTGYIMITVNPNDYTLRRASWTGTEVSHVCNYHKDYDQCAIQHENRLGSDASVIHFTNDAFLDQKDFRERDSHISSIRRYLEHGTSNEYFKDDVREIFLSGASFYSIVSSHELQSEILYYQLVTNVGLHRVYPGLTLPDDYNPYEEAWFQRCRNSNGKITIGIPDGSPFGFDKSGISICKPLYYDSEDPTDDFYGVLNVVIKVNAFWKMITGNATECTDLHGCFLVNDAGLIVLHSDWFHNSLSIFDPVHFMKEEPHIAKRLKYTNAIQECFAVASREGPKLQKSWRLQPAITGYTGFSVADIPNTNLFLIVKKQALNDDPCYCGERSETNLCGGENETCFCPCYEIGLNGYDPCTGEFSFTSDSPVPCRPESRKFDFSHVIENDKVEKEICVSTTEDRKEAKANKASIIASVLLIFFVVAISILLVAIYCRCKLKSKDETYADMVIPTNLQETVGACTPPIQNVGLSSESSSNGFTKDIGSAPIDEKRSNKLLPFDLAMGAPVGCDQWAASKEGGCTGVYLWHSQLGPRQSVPGAEADESKLNGIPTTQPNETSNVANLKEQGYYLAKDCSVAMETADPKSSQMPKSTTSTRAPVAFVECSNSAPSFDVHRQEQSDIDSNYLTGFSGQGLSNPAYENDSFSANETGKCTDNCTEI